MSIKTNDLGQMLGFIIVTLLVSPTKSASSNGPRFLSFSCLETDFSYRLGSTFEANLNYTLLTEILSNAVRLPYLNYSTNGTGIEQVFALYYCRGDVDKITCQQCVESAVNTILQRCKLKKQGIIWYEECTLRYSNHTISSLDEDAPVYIHYNSSILLSERLDPYRQEFDNTMKNLINDTAYNGNPSGFAAREVNLSDLSQTLRGLVQCSPFISSILCQKCLTTAFRNMYQWTNTMVHLPSCFIRFDLFQLPSPPPPPAKPDVQLILLAVLLPVIVILLLLGGFWLWRSRRRISGDHYNVAEATIEGTNSATEAIEVETDIEEARLQLARFTFAQVKDMTNEFNRKLGEGGYGLVYYGRLGDNHREVAIKVLSKNDAPKQFSNEVKVLGRIYHKNLVTLIGYCEEGAGNLALIYEYMSGGDLKALLSEHSGIVISWKRRLAIAFDTAQGLDYLHTGCSPPIVHRDVKPANILLNQNYHQAKVADFGFSKIFPAEYVSKLETRVIGTTGYVDPQYHFTGQVNEKSDVYSFGVVLLELITGKSAIIKHTNTHLVQWVTPLYERGDIGSILDPRLHLELGENYNTVWRATELAKKCVELDAANRPTMSDIVIELRECLAAENVVAMMSSSATTSMEMMTAEVSTTSKGPQPR